MHTRSFLRAGAAAALGPLALCTALAAPFTTAEFINGGFLDPLAFKGSSAHGADFSRSSLNIGIGFVETTAQSAPGALGGSAVVSMTGTEFASADLKGRAEVSTVDRLRFGTDYCLGPTCTSAKDLGITALQIDFDVHASGAVSAFAVNTQFDHAQASASYGFTLSGQHGSVSGGGLQERAEVGPVKGGITSMTATLVVTPGEELELVLRMALFAEASITGFRNSGFQGTHVFAEADFAHTLLWDGVSGVRAFGANGEEVTLQPGGRFTLIDSAGLDFWDAVPGFANPSGSVPAPAPLLLLLAAVPLALRPRYRRAEHAIT